MLDEEFGNRHCPAVSGSALGSVLENYFLSCASEQPLTLSWFPETDGIQTFVPALLSSAMSSFAEDRKPRSASLTF